MGSDDVYCDIAPVHALRRAVSQQKEAGQLQPQIRVGLRRGGLHDRHAKRVW